MYSSTLSLTSALDWRGWSTPRPSRFTPGKESRYALYRRLGGPQGRSGQMRKISLTHTHKHARARAHSADGGEARTNYRGPATRKGARSPTMLHMFLSFSVVSLFVNRPN
jgi:hypothetical protein